MQDLNEFQKGRIGAADSRLDAVIKSYQLAWRMQDAAPRVLDISEESEATQRAYGIGTKETDDFGRQCLLARRLCEAGVRFVQVNYADESPNPRGTSTQTCRSTKNTRKPQIVLSLLC